MSKQTEPESELETTFSMTLKRMHEGKVIETATFEGDLIEMKGPTQIAALFGPIMDSFLDLKIRITSAVTFDASIGTGNSNG